MLFNYILSIWKIIRLKIPLPKVVTFKLFSSSRKFSQILSSKPQSERPSQNIVIGIQNRPNIKLWNKNFKILLEVSFKATSKIHLSTP